MFASCHYTWQRQAQDQCREGGHRLREELLVYPICHNSTGKQDPNCRISALLCCLRQMVQLQAMMGFVSKYQKGSPHTLCLNSHSLKKSHLKVIHSYLCQGVLTSNKVPRKSSFASFLRKSSFLQISYQEFKVAAKSLSFHS